MFTLLFYVIICGIIAWLVQASEMPQPYKNIALAILLIIVVVVAFSELFGVGPGLPGPHFNR